MNRATDSDTIRVMIVDDHAMVRRGLAAFLRSAPGLELVGEAGDGAAAIRVCEETHPDVILMDLVMPQMDGSKATRAILDRWPHVRVIALTSFREKDLVRSVLEAGAIGYLLKSVSTQELADAIRAAVAGRPTLAPEVVRVLQLAERLDALGRAIAEAPASQAGLPALLREHVPGILPQCTVEVRAVLGQVLLRYPPDAPALPAAAWDWVRKTSRAVYHQPDEPLPWGDTQPIGRGLLAAPILTDERRGPTGGIIALRDRGLEGTADLLPGVQAVALQIGLALRSSQARDAELAHQRIAQELAVAGRLQESFLPAAPPLVPGWELAAMLRPARETSGDFYDFIPLPDGRLGLLVADVADKGMAAALYMALCRTLIRTHAAQQTERPDLVMAATNRRLLQDARANWFVTAFYGILDPGSGELAFTNAGHTPPMLVHREDGRLVGQLAATGMALGVLADATWTHARVCLGPGDALLLYSDGITEAQNGRGEIFGNGRLLELVGDLARKRGGERLGAQEILNSVLEAVGSFVADAPQSDDITLMVATRGVTGGARGPAVASTQGAPP